MRSKMVSVLFALPLFLMGPSWAGDHGTPDEAKAMAERAAAALQTLGPEKAFKLIVDGGDGLKDRDLYVFAYDNAGVCVAHGSNAGLVGRNLMDLRDFNGYQVIQNIVAVRDTGWVDFAWKNPVSGLIEQKHAYIKRVGEYVVGTGSYNPQK